MTDLLNKPDWLLDILTRPSVETLARLFPDRTIVHVIPFEVLNREDDDTYRALLNGGHRKPECFEPFSLAARVLVDDLEDIAREWEIDGYRVEHRVTANADLEVTMVFASLKDAVLFKLAMP